MCGRIGLTITRPEMLAAYPWLRDVPEVAARYNIAPTDQVLVLNGTRARLLTWGIPGPSGLLFNLRAETARHREPYRSLLAASRVVVPASFFYEWRRAGSRRLPYAIRRRDGAPVNLAGVIRRHEGRLGVTVLTTTPNQDLARLHDRMPVVLSDEDARSWALEQLTPAQLDAMLAPCPDGLLELRAASPLVNTVGNDGPQLLDPSALPQFYQLDLIDVPERD